MTSVILASRFNALRNRVNKVLGSSKDSDPDFGYGQEINDSSQVGSRDSVTSATTIDASDYQDLYIDLIKTRVHQVGASSVSVQPFVVGNYDANANNTDKVEGTFIESLEGIASSIESDRFLIDVSSQAAVEDVKDSSNSPVNSSRDSSTRGAWNGSLEHVTNIAFVSSASRRSFFNSGGEIRISFSVDYTGAQEKTLQWKSAGSDVGTVRLQANRTSNTAPTGTSANVGNYQLSTTYRLLYRYSIGGAYTNNYYEVFGMALSDNVIRIKTVFVDGEPLDTTYGIDENVFGVLTSSIQQLRPDGTATVNGVTVPTVVYDDTITGSVISQL